MKVPPLLIAQAVLLSLTALPAWAQSAGKRPGHSQQAAPKQSHQDLVAPGVKRAALLDLRDDLDFRAANFPKAVPAAQADFMDDGDYVLGITGNGESRAYPLRFVWWHHLVNDKIGTEEGGGRVFVAITYCNVCGTGVRFDPVVNGKPLQFDFYGIYNGVVTMYDRQTKSVWFQVGGRAVKGPLTGTELKCGPLLDTTWGEWKRLHPDTLVMAPVPTFRRFYDPKGTSVPRGFDRFPDRYFSKTLTHRDGRLPMFETVLAVSVTENVPDAPSTEVSGLSSGSEGPAEATPKIRHYRAYPIRGFKGARSAVNDEVGTVPVGVLFERGTRAATAVCRLLDGQVLTLEVRKGGDGRPAFFDKETGTRWNIEGQAEAGPLAGRSLARIDSHMSQWYGWVSYFPQTSIFGQDKAKLDTAKLVSARTVAAGAEASIP
jgi:hypothetical protein